jgi:hypothetical protein
MPGQPPWFQQRLKPDCVRFFSRYHRYCDTADLTIVDGRNVNVDILSGVSRRLDPLRRDDGESGRWAGESFPFMLFRGTLAPVGHSFPCFCCDNRTKAQGSPFASPQRLAQLAECMIHIEERLFIGPHLSLLSFKFAIEPHFVPQASLNMVPTVRC